MTLNTGPVPGSTLPVEAGRLPSAAADVIAAAADGSALRIDRLTSIRGFAALHVAIYHTFAFTRRAHSAVMSLLGALTAIALLGVFARAAQPPGITAGLVHIASHGQLARPFDLTWDYGLVRVTAEFIAGLFLWRAYSRLHTGPSSWAAPAAIASLSALLLTMHVQWRGFEAVQDPVAVILTGAFILCLALDRVRLRRFFEHRIPVLLGEAS